MRITGGVLRGRRVAMPPGEIRPAMDRMRESVFAVLGDLSGFSFLDLFSGSGIIALEAASRGAAYVEAVEKDVHKRETLLCNVKLTEAAAQEPAAPGAAPDAEPAAQEPAVFNPVRIRCRFQPVERYIERARRSFDLIFCDPPFAYQWKKELLLAIARSPLMTEGTRLLIHYPRDDAGPEPAPPAGLNVDGRREYGRSIVDFFIKNRLY